jgi:hypothetical protein
VSRVTVAAPAVVVAFGSLAKDAPFHAITRLDAVILDARKVAEMGPGNVPG